MLWYDVVYAAVPRRYVDCLDNLDFVDYILYKLDPFLLQLNLRYAQPKKKKLYFMSFSSNVDMGNPSWGLIISAVDKLIGRKMLWRSRQYM